MCGQTFLIQIDMRLTLETLRYQTLQLGHLRPRPTLSLDNSSPESQDQDQRSRWTLPNIVMNIISTEKHTSVDNYQTQLSPQQK